MAAPSVEQAFDKTLNRTTISIALYTVLNLYLSETVPDRKKLFYNFVAIFLGFETALNYYEIDNNKPHHKTIQLDELSDYSQLNI